MRRHLAVQKNDPPNGGAPGIARIALLTIAALSLTAPIMAQTPGAATMAAPAPLPATRITPIFQPSLETVRGTVAGLHIDKWKKGNIRDEAMQNIDQIKHDLDANLPTLLRTADAAPGSLSRMLPVARNVNALYDVLLRVVAASRVIAPDEQVARLQDALVALGNARLRFGETMQNSADAMERQAADLRATINSQQAQLAAAAAATPVAQPCTPPPARKTTKKSSRSATKKPSPATAAPGSSTTTHP
jgi:hypothetical protein